MPAELPAEFNITLTFDGVHWCAPVNDQLITATRMADLEARISHAVQHLPRFAAYESIRVNLNCDTSILPKWLRQYHAHYFNSSLTITKPVSHTRDVTT